MIDTHCHIDDPQYQDNLDAFLREQQAEGVESILVPGVNADSIEPVWDICSRYPDYLYPAIGLHPEDVKEDWEAQLALMEQALAHRTYIAIGEIGLDYHFDTTYKVQQQEAFRRQLGWAQNKNLPVMIHARDATEDCLRIIHEANAARPNEPLRGVMHCFSGSHETAQQIIKMGLYLGIGGVITFKNCKLAANLQDIPLSRLVLETDAPYMAPVPYRGKRNESRWMIEVVRKLREVYPMTAEDIIRATTQNAKALFGLK